MNSSDSGATNSMANAVMNDQVALEQLVQKTMAEITGTKAEQRRAVKDALNRMFSEQTSESVDTASSLGYDNINNSQEGAIDYGTGAENVIGGNGRNTEVNPGVLPLQGTANSGGDVRPGDPGRIPGGHGEGTVHTSDSEGRELTPEISERISGTAVVDNDGIMDTTNVSTDGGQSNDIPGGQQSVAEQNPGIKGTGAAEGNFSGKPAYNATLSEDNAQADRRDDVRPMELPQQDINRGNVKPQN